MYTIKFIEFYSINNNFYIYKKQNDYSRNNTNGYICICISGCDKTI